MKTSSLLSLGTSICLGAVTWSSHAQVSTPGYSKFQMEAYSLEYPPTWTHRGQQSPDGTLLQIFEGPIEKKALTYCHVTQQALKPELAPHTSKMTLKQRQEFFSTSSDQQLLFSLYDSLPSAQDFRLVHTNATVLSGMPAFLADFSFRVPQGFYYRVRSHYTFWPKGQISIWCQTNAKREEFGDDAFRRNLANFQQFIASVKIK